MAKMRRRVWEWVVRFTLSPFAEILTWVGTLFGGILVSGAQDRTWLIFVGAAIVLVSVLPLAIQGAIQWRQERQDDYKDARESVALEYSTRALRLAAAIEKQPRARRVTMSQAAVVSCIDSVWAGYFEHNSRVRVVLFLIIAPGDALKVELFRGRDERPRDFVSGEPRTSIAVRQLSLSDESVYVPDISRLETDWGASGRTYSTFIRLPIRTTSDAYGMLTVDSTRAADLSQRDAVALEVYSTALAFFLATAARGEHNRRGRGGEQP